MLTNQIKSLESIAKTLEPNKQLRAELWAKANAYCEDFLDNIYSSPAYIENHRQQDQLENYPVQSGQRDIDKLLTLLGETVDHVGINPASEGHLGYIPGGGIYASAVADFMADVTNRYAGLYFGSPGAVKLENLMIRWSADLIGYPKESLGNITSGGSIANLIAVTTARDAKGISPDKITKAVIYFTEQTHHCVDKAVRIAGLGTSILRRIPLDDQFRMNVDELKLQINSDKASGLIPFYIAASCGSTDTGAVDRMDAIADVAEEHNIWFHVDAAYGGYFILVDELKVLFTGIERSDSVALDPHKSLFLPYGTGIVLIRDGKAMFDSHFYMASYLQDAYDGNQDISPADLSPELTKHFRGLRLWLPLQLYGIEPFRAGLTEKHLLTKYFHKAVQKLGFEVGPDPQLSVAIYRYVPKYVEANRFNEALVREIQQDGRIFVSSTNIKGVYWIRIAIVCFRTHLVTIDRYLDILKEKVLVIREKMGDD